MALSQRLDIRQTQGLVMTPQLQQAIKLLQMSNVEVADFVASEVEQNPMLEKPEFENGDGASSAADSNDSITAMADSYLGTMPDLPGMGLGGERADSHSLGARETLDSGNNAPLDTDYGNVFQDDKFGGDETASSWREARGQGGSGDEMSFEQNYAAEQTLRDFLIEQMSVEIADGHERAIAMMLLDHLDEAGWLQADLPSLAEQLGCALPLAEKVLGRLQKFEPTGIFARSLKECLALQLAERNRLDPAMAALLDNLELLAARNWSALKKKCGVDDEDLRDMALEIKALNPKPAFGFAQSEAPTLVPDVMMKILPNGGFSVELNAETLPRVLVNDRYFIKVKGATQDKTELSYINERYQSANWLLKALNQRANTILKVASEIVSKQETFFYHGLNYLRPLILRDIAEATGLHESTVSRVTANKYIATPRGVFELKFFFSVAIASAPGQLSHSAEAVRGRIRKLIDAEPPEAILSDDQIVAMLQKEGVELARRTVAKYREAMDIPSSSARRRAKRG